MNTTFRTDILKIFFLIFIFLSSSFTVLAQEAIDHHLAAKPAQHAPISVMGDHTHNKGEWMFSYRFMHMNMEDLKQGSDDVPFSTALNTYMATPIKMTMDMHMLGTMYAPSEKLTLMVMLNYVSKEMGHTTRMGGFFTTNSSGIGDTKVAGLYRFLNKPASKLHLELGLFIPTGSVEKEDVIPASAPNSVILPYPMQIGSGTWDPTLALTYLLENGSFNFGFQGRSRIRTGTNSNEYRLGNRFELSTWSGYNLNSWLSFSARIQGLRTGGIKGVNPTLNPLMVITADTNNSGGEYINGGIGFNMLFPGKIGQGLRLGAEFKHPLYQKLNGIQLKQNESISLGIQYSL